MFPRPPSLRHDGVLGFGWSVPGAEVRFLTREGGASAGPFRGLNVDPTRGDDRAAVAVNHALVLDALGVEGVFLPTQVHGTAILEAGEPVEGFTWGGEGDAVMSARAGSALGVMTADCLPVLLHHRRARAAAAVHAGWRSLAGGIVPAAVRELLRRWGGKAEEIEAFLGPCIGPCCFEVEEEVAGRIAASAGSDSVIDRCGGTPRADLWAAARLQLAASGVAPERVRAVELCTSCRADLFYSFRRDNGVTGRMASVIVLR